MRAETSVELCYLRVLFKFPDTNRVLYFSLLQSIISN